MKVKLRQVVDTDETTVEGNVMFTLSVILILMVNRNVSSFNSIERNSFVSVFGK